MEDEENGSLTTSNPSPSSDGFKVVEHYHVESTTHDGVHSFDHIKHWHSKPIQIAVKRTTESGGSE